MTSSVSSLGSSQISSQIQQYESRLEAPITVLKDEETTDKAQISAWGSISGAVSSLSSALSGIKDVTTLNNRAVSSTTTNVATATASINSATGTFNLSNVTLAKTQEIYSSLQTSASGALSGGAGSLTFALQNGKTESVSIGSGSLNLNAIAAAVNKTKGGVQASVVNSSTGARLVFQGSSTGSSQAFSVAGTGALSRFAYSTSSPGTEVLSQAAANANLTLNGVPVSSTSNTLSSAVNGVTITLAGSGNTTLSVSSSPSTLSTAVNKVANNLNSALSAIAKEIKYVPPSSAASASASKSSSSAPKTGPLLGNFTATDLSNQLMSAVSGADASGMSAKAIGLTVSSTGGVSFDSATFATAYAQNPSAVQSLIGKIYTSLSSISTGAIGNGSSTSTDGTGGTSAAATGSVGAATTSLQATVTSIGDQITQLSKQDSDQIQQLINEYTITEAAQQKASITESYLSIFSSSNSASG
jgi:flagellar hook-associated protein 2